MHKLWILVFICIINTVWIDCLAQANQEVAGNDVKAYIPYGKQLYFMQDCTPDQEGNDPCAPMYENWAYEARGYILMKAKNEYLARYGYLTSPVLKKEDLIRYKTKAEAGDLTAIFELRRYYENPDNPDYDPEQIEARKWLLAAIKAGSREAMFELGYEEPYIAETVLKADDVPVSVYAACDKLHKNSAESSSGCFLYILTIGLYPELESSPPEEELQPLLKREIPPELKATTYLILNPDCQDQASLRPRGLALRQFNGKTIVELTSSGNDNGGSSVSRKDFFDLSGQYLGVDSDRFSPRYFWNFSRTSTIAPPLLFNPGRKLKPLTQIPISTSPAYDAFAFMETNRAKIIHAIDDCIYGVREIPPGLEQSKEYLDYMFRFGSRPEYFRNPVKPYNIGPFIEKAEKGDRDAMKLLYEFYFNPLNIPGFQPNEGENWEKRLGLKTEENRFGYINTRQAPYITKTIASAPEIDFQALMICQGPDSSVDYHGASNCFAIQLQIKKGNNINYHYLIDGNVSTRSFDKDFSNINWALANPSINFIFDSEKLRELSLNDMAYGSGTNAYLFRHDYFTAVGEYVGSEPAQAASTLVYGFQAKSPTQILSKSDTSKSLWSLHKVLSYSPSWDDQQILLRRSSEER